MSTYATTTTTAAPTTTTTTTPAPTTTTPAPTTTTPAPTTTTPAPTTTTPAPTTTTPAPTTTTPAPTTTTPAPTTTTPAPTTTMTTTSVPSISQGQFAIDPYSGILYYKDSNNTLVNASLNWHQSSSSLIETQNSVNINSDITVSGNLTISGSTTTLNTENITIRDNIIILNSNVTETPSVNAGIEIERGIETNVLIRWNETADKWQFTNDGVSYSDLISITELDIKANLASPTFTGTVSGITKTMVGLGNVDNTADTAKPVSTLQQNALDLKVDQTALDLKADLVSPTFTGTVSGVSAAMVGLGNVDNTSDADKPVSTATQTAFDFKASISGQTFTGAINTPNNTASMIPFYYANEAAFPSASNSHGAIAHSHATGLMYYAHGGNWIELANTSSPTFTGTVTLPSETVTSAMIADETIVNADISPLAAIALDKIASGTPAQIIIANSAGTPSYTMVSGDVTIDSSGVVLIQPEKIVNADINASAAIELSKLAVVVIKEKVEDHTLFLTDATKFIKMDVSTENTVTIPLNSSVSFPIGTQIHIIQYGLGKTQVIPWEDTFTIFPYDAATPLIPTEQVIIYATPGNFLRTQYSSATLLKCDTNEWILMGDLSAS